MKILCYYPPEYDVTEEIRRAELESKLVESPWETQARLARQFPNEVKHVRVEKKK